MTTCSTNDPPMNTQMKMGLLAPARSSMSALSLQKIFDATPDIICTIDAYGRFITINKAALSFWQYHPYQLSGTRYIDMVVEEDKAKTIRTAHAAMQGANINDFENRFYRKDATIITLSWSAAWCAEEQTLYCTARDITQKSKKEKQFNQQKQLLNKAQQMLKTGVWELDIYSNETYWSDELYHIYGISKNTAPQDLLPRLLSIIHPDDLEAVKADMELQKSTANTEHIYRIVHPDGKVAYIQHHGKAVKDYQGNISKIIGTAQDITERMEYALKLKQSEQRFRSLIEHGSDITGVIDAAGNYDYISDNAKTILGYHPADFTGKNVLDFIHPDDAPAICEQLTKLSTEKYVEVKPFRFKNANGEWRHIETKATNLTDDPAIGGIVINSRDITERKAIEDRLHMLSLIVEQTKNSVVITDAQQRIIWINAAFEQITGYTLAEVAGKRPFDFFRIEAGEQTLQQIQAAYIEKKPVSAAFANYSKSGKKYWVESQMQPVLNEEGKVVHFFGLQYNITERKRLEEQLQKETEQRQKRIAAAIIHTQEKERAALSRELHDNVNQVLTTVKLYNEMSLHNEGSRQQLIENSIQHLNYCINEIRSVSKTLSSYTLKDMGLKDSITELMNAINIAGKLKIQFKWHGINKDKLPEEVQLAVFRITQEQLSNILKHATAQNVKIAITTSERQLALRITDDGKGFDTTQERSGMGLANMHHRIEALNGRLEITSAPGQGCTIVAALPLNK